MYKNGLILFSFLILSLLLSACGGSQPGINTDPGITAGPPRGNTGTITTGNTVAAASVQVPTSGGTLTVSEPGTPITGLELTIPANAYADLKTFEISYAPIEKHSFGDSFNPITPLISIDNGGEYADEIMAVRIPVTVPPDNFAMGFIYDEKSKTLSGLPTLDQDAFSLTVGTRHFTDLIISMIPLAKLKKDIDSGFRPGIDDWQFTNYGSYVAKGGHCAGQSVAALWYYVTQPDGKDLTLYGRYDNNGIKPETPNFWQDDSKGYRFVSTVHDDINWQSFENKFWTDLAGVDDDLTWKLFAYSMQITGEPQEVGIYSKAGGGHDMICYRVKDGNLYIADPNYPGNTERRIEFKDGKFAPYNSGANADEIAKGNGKAYETIEYCAKTTTLGWDKIAQRWAEFKAGTVGDGLFPAYQIVYKDANGKYPELKDGLSYPNKLIAITTSSVTPDTGCFVYRDGVLLKWDADGNYELVPGINKLGIYITGMVDAKDKAGNPIKVPKFIDFKSLSITYGQEGLVMDPVELHAEPGKPATVTARMANPPAGARYDWHIAGTVKQSGTDASFTYTYPNAGFYALWVEIFDVKGKKVAETTGRAVIMAQVDTPATLTNLQKLQQLKSISGAFSGKNTYSLSTGGEMVNGSSISVPFIPITWSGTSFSGKIVVEDNNSPSTDEIQGTVSADGNALLNLSFNHSDYNYGGYGKSNPNYMMYTKSMQLQNVPLSQYEIGKGVVSGPATQGCVVKLEYKETSFKNGIKSYEKTYLSTDWAASGIGATPQIQINFGK